jgi:hypothetical protein
VGKLPRNFLGFDRIRQVVEIYTISKIYKSQKVVFYEDAENTIDS